MTEYKECLECANCADSQDHCALYCMCQLEQENEKLRSIIKELADALNNIRENTDYDVEYGCCGGWIITYDNFIQSSIDELVNKTLEVIKE